MNGKDEFGRDPVVRKTRVYFSKMEALDSRLIEESGVSRFDTRLRQARESRLRLFEAACSRAYGKGIALDEETALEIFEICQDLAFRKAGLPVSIPDRTFNNELVSLVNHDGA